MYFVYVSPLPELHCQCFLEFAPLQWFPAFWHLSGIWNWIYYNWIWALTRIFEHWLRISFEHRLKFFEPWLVLTLAFFCPCFLRFSFFCLLFGTWNRKIISFYGTICWISHIPRHASSACVFSKWLKCCTYCCTVCIFLLNPAHSSALAIFCVQTWCAVSMLAAFWMMKCTADTCTALLRFLDCF